MASEYPYSSNPSNSGDSSIDNIRASTIEKAKTAAHNTLNKACDKVHPALDTAFSAAHSAIDGAAERAKNAAETLNSSSEKISEMQHRMTESIRNYIQDKPLTAVGIAIGAGVFLSSFLRKH